jgi:hypothetical protein
MHFVDTQKAALCAAEDDFWRCQARNNGLIDDLTPRRVNGEGAKSNGKETTLNFSHDR